MVRNKISHIDSRKHANHSFITEGIPWKLHLTIGIYRKTTGTTFLLYKKERERRSRLTRTLVSWYDHPAESEFRRRLRSASSHKLSIPRTRLSTYGDRAFPVAAVRICNSLPQHITFCSVTSCLLLSLEDILLRTLLAVITVICGHVSRSYLLILTYSRDT